MLQMLQRNKIKKVQGFSLLETLLAVVVIVIAGMGVYSLFSTGLSGTQISDAEDEVIQIANVYTDLASSDLTGSEGIETLLQNSGRLSSKYFSATGSDTGAAVQINNAFGSLVFSNVTAYSYTVAVPLGCLPATSSIPQDFYKKVQDVYSCASTGCEVTSVCPTTLTLYFNLNN